MPSSKKENKLPSPSLTHKPNTEIENEKNLQMKIN